MASRRISYQWRLFLPVVVIFWAIMISMAFWQVYRVHEVKQELVNDQMELVGERIADFYNNHDDIDYLESFTVFVNQFYEESRHYDPMSVLVRDPDGVAMINIGVQIPDQTEIPIDQDGFGRIKLGDVDFVEVEEDFNFLYYTTDAKDGTQIYVFLPYTKELVMSVSGTTTTFWIIFFAIAVFITVIAYFSSHYLSQNIRSLQKFVNRAADDPDFVATGLKFPHNELGDISRQIISLYNQRVHEMERREKEHKVALNAIEDKEKMKRELTGNINHELKTPVGVIQGYIDTIMGDPNMDAETRTRFLKKTQDNVHRLTALINDITAITKLESGGRLVNVEEINFHDLVYKLDYYVNENKLLKKMKFSYDLPLDCKILGNDSLLNSVLLNFIKNSVAYSEGKNCCLECEKEDENFYYFKYYDDGVGVPPESISHIFERFYRVNAGRSREAGGTGLGLAIVQVTITSLGGTISVQNRKPSGLEYHFTLPKHKKRGTME